MLNYNLMLRKFKKCCEKKNANVEELYKTITELMPDKYKVEFAFDVLRFKPSLVNLGKLNKEVIDSRDTANCVRLLEQSCLLGGYLEQALKTIAFYGSAEDCYRVIMCLDLKSNCKKLKTIKTDNEKGLNMLRYIYLIDTKVLNSKNAQYNYDIAKMFSVGDLAEIINKKYHTKVVIESGNGEYLAKLLSATVLLDLNNSDINDIVDVLCDKKYATKYKCEALKSLYNLSSEQYFNYIRLYQSIFDVGNPVYIYALKKSPKYSKKYNIAREYMESREKDYSDMDLVCNNEQTLVK